MRKILSILCILGFIACDDGDIIVEDLQFNNTSIQACLPAQTTGSRTYVFYEIENNNFETLSLEFTTDEEIFEEGSYGPFSIPNNQLEFRSFDGSIGNDYFCSIIPPSSPQVIRVFEATSGDILINTIFTFDDDDGVPASDEGINLEDLISSTDTDSDGIPDYYDSDDDGDNVPTQDEISSGIITDTDNDGIPDYLDPDDDGDGVLTINESTDGDNDPTNDITGGVRHYLNPSINNEANPVINSYIEHEYQQTPTLLITINDLTLSNGNRDIIFETYEMGTYIGSATEIRVTPDF